MQIRIRVPGLLTLTAGLLFSLNAAAGQVAQKPEVRDLEPGVNIERELAGGDEHHYRIALKTGQHAGIQIVKQGVNVTLTVKSLAGESLFTANLESLEQGESSRLQSLLLREGRKSVRSGAKPISN